MVIFKNLYLYLACPCLSHLCESLLLIDIYNSDFLQSFLLLILSGPHTRLSFFGREYYISFHPKSVSNKAHRTVLHNFSPLSALSIYGKPCRSAPLCAKTNTICEVLVSQRNCFIIAHSIWMAE